MLPRLQYKSFGFLPFDTIRISVFGFIVIWVVLRIMFSDSMLAAIWGATATILSVLAQIAISYVVVSRKNFCVEVQTFRKFLSLEEIHSIHTWWTYDFGFATTELGTGSPDKGNTHANKIICFVEFISEKGSLFIYEQIHLGEKFPNNHPYQPMRKIDISRVFRVWDIDKCLEELRLNELEEVAKGVRKLIEQH